MDNKIVGSTGIILLNLGGPDSLEAVRPFLFNLFSDREIIRLGPSFMQRPLAHLISSLRHKKTESYYSLIGGKSPILDITIAQAKALEEELNKPSTLNPHASSIRVFIGMRYWKPLIEDVVPEICRQGIGRLIALGLYPHYSIATTGSSLARLNQVVSGGCPMEVFTISSWFDNPFYVDALIENIKKGIKAFSSSRDKVHVLFSAHSLPVKFIEEGDPYVRHIHGTISAITERMDMDWDLSYQSKSGPVKWLGPSTDEMIEALAGKGVRKLLIVPISFVSDHIETLYEIDILYRQLAAKLGMEMKRVDSLNTCPLFISALKDIIVKGIKEAGWAE